MRHAMRAGVVSTGVGVAALVAIGLTAPPLDPQHDPAPNPGGDQSGPDMTFCQLFGLRQFAKIDTTLGLAQGTTSWNIGDADLMWFASPDNRHPFIVSNLYRLENDRFEQVGQSWVKHGFYALGNTQCGGQCRYEPGHREGNWLGQGCTDTYTASLNASQSGLGPRFEINPWTGAWSYQGSYFQQGRRAEDAVDRLLQVEIDDINPDLHPTAEWFSEGYYVVLDDINVMNSAAWKPVTPQEHPNNNWAFQMTPSWERPVDGFALYAWPDARFTTIAQELPVVEFVSPDGRCVLGAKAIRGADGFWRYEYALLNIDMDRKVGSFSIPLPPGTTVRNAGFHAPKSRNEPYSNDPWTVEISNESITWSTVDNPVRWGTVYSFRFECDRGPDDATATLGHFEPGAPAAVEGVTWGPGTRALGLTLEGDCPGAMTATISGGTPGTRVALVYADARGSFTIPPGFACAGTTLDLDATARQVGPVVRFDANGVASLMAPDVPLELCGGVVQALTADGCGVSTVVVVE
ncbi:MAG: hypothetical protein ACF8PN_06160 [Phycisphaerales bacterium]